MKLKNILSIFILLMTFSCQEKNTESDFKGYIPQVFDGDRLVEMPKMMTEKHTKNVIHVLNYYGEKWKFENGTLLVSEKKDREILWNYTSKAEDSIWLREHK